MAGVKVEVKYSSLRKEFRNKTFIYTCTHCEWNYWLNRLYPSAKLIMIIEKLT
jgi:hypothetical protein